MISFVYFDLGGVVILDFSGTNKWEEMKRDMGVNEKNKAAFDAVWKKYRERISIDYDVDSLPPIFEKEVGLKFPVGYSMLDDFANRFEQNSSIWPVIEKIQKTCRIGLLTNVYPRMLEAIQKRRLLPPIDWDVVVDSSVVGYQKPDRKIFEIAQTRSGVKGEEILFVENSPEHIHAAQVFGWQTFLYNSSDPVKSSQELASYFL